MGEIKAFAAHTATTPLSPHTIRRREPGPTDVEIDIRYCGVCHSDIHQARNEWGGSVFPMVPGHEIVGVVTRIGANVTLFKPGDLAGIGCFVDSCRTCHSCTSGEEQFCENGAAWTYNSTEMDRKTITHGGYSTLIVTDEKYTLKISEALELSGVAPLLCAGITTYSPLRHWNVGKGSKVAVFGLGGLGHMGVKFAAAFGAEVTVLSTSRSKEADARRMGAQDFVVISDEEALKKRKNYFNFILNTVSAHHDYNQYLQLLTLNGTMTLVGIPPDSIPVKANTLIGRRRSLAGSLIGGIRETQEMLDFCAEKNIVSDIELIPIQKINEAYDRMIRSDVRYRFVIDIASLKN